MTRTARSGRLRQELFGLMLFGLAVAPAPLPAQAELWDRAVERAKLGEAFLPHLMVPSMQELDSGGSPENTMETVTRVICDASCGVRDGKDLTFELEYAALPSGGFVLSRMRFEGTLVLLLKRTRFRGAIEFGEHSRKPPQAKP